MSFFDALRHRLGVLRRGEEYADEQAREFAFHLELGTLEHSPFDANSLEAQHAARRQFGSVTRYREAAREMSPLAWLDRLRRNLGYAWRCLKREPGFAIAVIVTLSLGVGLNGAVFTLLDRLFVQPPEGVSAPRELRRFYQVTLGPLSGGVVAQLRRDHPTWTSAQMFNSVAKRYIWESNLFIIDRAIASVIGERRVATYTRSDGVGIEDPAKAIVKRTYVSANYFAVLGARLQLGRAFTPEEAQLGHATPPLVVISDDLWRRVFRRDASVIGRKLRFGTETYTVVGVAARGFSGTDLDRVDLWSPLANLHGDVAGTPWDKSYNRFDFFRTIARMPSGMSLALYDDAIAAQLHEQGLEEEHIIDGPIIELPRASSGDPFNLLLSADRARVAGLVGPFAETSVSLRIAAVALIVLLLACANVANLLLLRTARRGRETAIRRALGASRARLTEQFLVESVLLAAAASVAAVAVAYCGGKLLRQLLFPSISWSGGVIDLRAIVFVSTVAFFAGVLAAVAPAAAATNPNMTAILRGPQDRGSRGRGLRSALVIVQTALCVVLVVGATLFVRSLRNVEAVRLGFATREVASTGILWRIGEKEKPEASRARIEQLQLVAAALRSFPGVRSTAVASKPPLRGLGVNAPPVFRPGNESIRVHTTEGPWPDVTGVSRDYFETVGIARIEGRTFGDADFAPNSPPVMVVSRQLARELWPGQSPIGQCLVIGLEKSLCYAVIGVVDDVHLMKIIEPEFWPQAYVPFGRAARPTTAIVVRASPSALGRVTGELRKRLMNIVPEDRRDVTTLAQVLEPELRPWRVGAQFFSLLGTLALIVAAVGIYSVASYAMTQRTHEIGVRLALGARTEDVFRVIALRGLSGLIAGVALGALVAAELAPFVASLLFGVKPTDLPTLVGAGLGVLAVGTLARIIPAWRASQIDPVRTLAAE